MQKEVDRAEAAENEALKKYAEARSNVNDLSEQLMAERHRLNITATELEQKQDRVTKLLSERYSCSNQSCFKSSNLGIEWKTSSEKNSQND